MALAAVTAAAIRMRLADLIEDDDPADIAFAVRLLGSFADRGPLLLDALDAAVAAGDVQAVRDRAHALKGAASNVGVDPVARRCAEAEAHARQGQLSDAAARVEPIRAALAAAVPELLAARQALLDGYGDAG